MYRRNRSTDYKLCMYGVRIYIVARGEEVGRQVGRRLAAGLHHPGDGARIALAADQEDSPLQSKRSSRFSILRVSSISVVVIVFHVILLVVSLLSFLLLFAVYSYGYYLDTFVPTIPTRLSNICL